MTHPALRAPVEIDGATTGDFHVESVQHPDWEISDEAKDAIKKGGWIEPCPSPFAQEVTPELAVEALHYLCLAKSDFHAEWWVSRMDQDTMARMVNRAHEKYHLLGDP